MSERQRVGLFTGKKAFVYSMIGVVVLIILLSIFINSRDSSRASKSYSESLAIKGMDEKIESIGDDIERGAYIVGFRTILSMDNLVATNRKYFEGPDPIDPDCDLNCTFYEIFMNGTYQGNNITYMENMSFSTFIVKLKSSFSNLNMNIDTDIKDVEIIHESSWHVTVKIIMEMNVSDKAGLASWSGNNTFSAEVPIIEMTDPVYLVNTGGSVMNQIFRTNITDFTQLDNLKDHVMNMSYKESDIAPSYLSRLSGKLHNADTYGIESLVFIPKLALQGNVPLNRSIVDYIYFDGGGDFKEAEMGGDDWFYLDAAYNKPWFKLDDDHRNIYDPAGMITWIEP